MAGAEECFGPSQTLRKFQGAETAFVGNLSVPIQENPVPMAELVGDVVNACVPEIYGETASVGSPYKLCDLGQFLNLSPSFLIFKMEITVHT